MPSYSVLFAEDVPHYVTITLEADDDKSAIAAATQFDLTSVHTKPEWSSSQCKRIVDISDSAGLTIAEGISLDNCFRR